MSQQKKFSFENIVEFFLPKEELEPARKQAVKSLLTASINIMLLLIILNALWSYIDAPLARIVGNVMLLGVIISLIFCKLGFPDLYRIFYMIVSGLTILFAYQFLGSESFLWVYSMQAFSAYLFVTAPSEVRLRRTLMAITTFCLLLTLVVSLLGIIPSEVPVSGHKAIVYFGNFNVVFSTILLLLSVIRYQREVTEYKGRLQAQSITMIQQTKMSSLGEMAAGVAHEINNPLGVILGKVEGLERRVKNNDLEPTRLLADFGKIQEVVKRIAKIVKALRTFARDADDDPFELCRSDELIEETLSLCMENMTLNKVEIRVTGQKGIEFSARPAQISQVLVSLINNSFDAVKALPQKWIEIHTECTEKLRISVTDSGRGIPEALADKIMQPFFTTKEIGKGTGLGLSTAKGIIEAHNGTLLLDRSCANTKFVIELPLQKTTSLPV